MKTTMTKKRISTTGNLVLDECRHLQFFAKMSRSPTVLVL